ncbi:MAG: acyl-CoA reductase [Chitinophagaceae bacterium]
MAGNIPLVGFHDSISVFLAGHHQTIKLSSKDNTLLPHLIQAMGNEHPILKNYFTIAEHLKGCDAYIATGSNNSARYFEQYFSKYPHIIRKNRTSIAILDGTESIEELGQLSDDIQLYFGLGCRNITQIFVPDGYDFNPLLKALEKYDFLKDFHKYNHNYDYALTINLLNKKMYHTNGSIMLSPDNSPFSGIASLNYAYYQSKEEVIHAINRDEIQLIAGHGFIPFGQAQCPTFTDFADGIDTLKFLISLNKN